jgi:hypothetical protein
MNLLPFVAIFILAITLAITSLFQDSLSLSYLKTSHNGLSTAYRIARNSAEESRYLQFNKSLKNKTDSEKKVHKTERKLKKLKDRNQRENITENSKFNIYPLLHEKNHDLEKIFIQLINNLYLNTNLFNEKEIDKANTLQKLSKSILKGLREELSINPNSTLDWKRLRIQEKNLRTLYYKMLKGSPNYPKKKSYPCLEHFFIIKKESEKKVIHAKKACKLMLSVFFGKEITDQILRKELELRELNKNLLREDIVAILKDNNFSKDLEKYIHYGHEKIIKRTEIETDPQSGIKAEISYDTTKRI